MNWFEKHLNWTYVLANLSLSLIVFLAWEARWIGVILVVAGGAVKGED